MPKYKTCSKLVWEKKAPLATGLSSSSICAFSLSQPLPTCTERERGRARELDGERKSDQKAWKRKWFLKKRKMERMQRKDERRGDGFGLCIADSAVFCSLCWSFHNAATNKQLRRIFFFLPSESEREWNDCHGKKKNFWQEVTQLFFFSSDIYIHTYTHIDIIWVVPPFLSIWSTHSFFSWLSVLVSDYVPVLVRV